MLNPYAEYKAQAAATASPAQLVLMLYNGAIAEVARAERGLAQVPVDHTDVHDCLTRAQAIVRELSLTLDRERGGVIAANLASLYAFCTERLVDANVRKDAAPLAAATDVLTQVRDSWEQACVLGQPAPVGAGVA